MSLILDPKDDTCMGPCIHIKYSMVHKSGGFTKQNPHKKQAACISNPRASTKHKQIARPLKSRSRSMAGRLRSFPDPVHMREGSCQARSRALGSGHVKRASTYPSVRRFISPIHCIQCSNNIGRLFQWRGKLVKPLLNVRSDHLQQGSSRPVAVMKRMFKCKVENKWFVLGTNGLLSVETDDES
jgi:hypothetical protein